MIFLDIDVDVDDDDDNDEYDGDDDKATFSTFSFSSLSKYFFGESAITVRHIACSGDSVYMGIYVDECLRGALSEILDRETEEQKILV